MKALSAWIGRQHWGPFVVGLGLVVAMAVSTWWAFTHHRPWAEWFGFAGIGFLLFAGALPNRLAVPFQFILLILLNWAFLDGKPLTLATIVGLDWYEKLYLLLCLMFGIMTLWVLFKRPGRAPTASHPAAN